VYTLGLCLLVYITSIWMQWVVAEVAAAMMLVRDITDLMGIVLLQELMFRLEMYFNFTWLAEAVPVLPGADQAQGAVAVATMAVAVVVTLAPVVCLAVVVAVVVPVRLFATGLESWLLLVVVAAVVVAGTAPAEANRAVAQESPQEELVLVTPMMVAVAVAAEVAIMADQVAACLEETRVLIQEMMVLI
jgi:hypothetical protein